MPRLNSSQRDFLSFKNKAMRDYRAADTTSEWLKCLRKKRLIHKVLFSYSLFSYGEVNKIQKTGFRNINKRRALNNCKIQ